MKLGRLVILGFWKAREAWEASGVSSRRQEGSADFACGQPIHRNKIVTLLGYMLFSLSVNRQRPYASFESSFLLLAPFGARSIPCSVF